MFEKRKIKKNDIYVYSKGYASLVVFFALIFLALLISFIELYCIKKQTIGVAFFVSIIFMFLFGGGAVFIYSMFGTKAFVKDNVIKIKKWNGISKKAKIEEVQKVVLEKRENKIVNVTIWIDNSYGSYSDEKVNFDKLKEYLLMNVDSSKIICFKFGTKKEVPI